MLGPGRRQTDPPPAQAASRPTAGGASRLDLAVAGLLLLSLLLGGAGNAYALIGGALQAGGVLLLAALGVSGRLFAPPRGSRLACLIAGLALLLPLLQLVPLPPSMWESLSGRALVRDVLVAAAVPIDWRPLSFDAQATRSAALELLPGLALFAATIHCRPDRQRALLRIVVAVAVGSAVLGSLQRASGALAIIASDHMAYAPGLFVNRNHQATFLLCAMPLTAALARSASARHKRESHALAIACLILLVLAAGTIATTSRMGLALLAPTGLASALLMTRSRRLHTGLAAAAILAGAVAAILSQSSAAQLVFQRLGGSAEDGRFGYWTDTWFAIDRYWPAGTGIGTFESVYRTVEDLDLVGRALVQDAHNDYVQLLLEGGAPALAILLLGLAFIMRAAVRLIRAGNAGPHSALGSLVAVLVVLGHSLVDYPLRMASIMALFGLLCGTLATATAPVERA